MMTLLLNLISGCATSQQNQIATVPQVDLPRFMGKWYVIAAIPTIIEAESFNAVESYRLDTDGTILTTFTFNKGSLDGKLKVFEPRGYVEKNTGNARWSMQFFWPIKSEYLIAYLDDDYSKTIIARNSRDYVWIMARQAKLKEDEYFELVQKVSEMGYDTKKLRKVPHRLN